MTITRKIELEVCNVNDRNIFIESIGKNINKTCKPSLILTLKENKKDIYDDLLKLRKVNFKFFNFITNQIQCVINKNDDKYNLTKDESNEIYRLVSEYSDKLKEEYGFNNIPSTIFSSAKQLILSNIKKTIKDIKSGKRIFPTYRENVPICLPKVSIVVPFTKLNEIDKNYKLLFWGILFKTNLGRDRSNNASIIEKIIDGSYKLCDSSLVVEKNKIFLNLCVEIEEIKVELDDDIVMGVDLGIAIPAVCCCLSKKLGKPLTLPNGLDNIAAFDKPYVKSKYINKYEPYNVNPSILDIRNSIKIEYEKRKKDAKYICTNGHGLKRKMSHVDILRKKEKRIAKLYADNLSKDIVKYAVENKCKTIHLEHLKGFKGDKVLMSGWGYFQLQELIKYKARKYGINVKLINPRNTSLTCSNCGHTSKNNRIDQAHFICEHCGIKINADFNASINIAKSEEIIK